MRSVNLSLKAKILGLALGPFFLFQVCLMVFNYYSTKEALMAEKRNMLGDVVASARGALESFHAKEQSGEISQEEAQTLAKNFLSKMRYGKDSDDYIWVNDYEPSMIVHPSASLRGQSLKSFKDKAGKSLFVDAVKLVKEKDQGYITYIWNSKADKNEFVPKLSYVEAFKPWGWILGTGIYIDDVEAYILKTLIKDASILGVCLLGIGLLIVLVLNRGVITPLLNIAGKLQGASSKVTSGSEESLKTSRYLSDATNEQASSLQETVSSIEEISKMIARNSDSADDSRVTSKRSYDSAQKGKRTVDEMLLSIQKIAENNAMAMGKMEESSKNTSEILEIIKEIDEKTKVINDIVFQTKLLSFNASVEAARAGEQGKGFAVVAEEVGSLAEMSGKASEEIKHLLEKSIGQVESIVSETVNVTKEVVASGAKTVQDGTDKANECKEAFDDILTNIENVSQRVEEIAEACREQSIGVQEITEAMRALDTVTHENNGAAQAASSNAQELKHESENLDHAVGEVLYLVNGNDDQIKGAA